MSRHAARTEQVCSQHQWLHSSGLSNSCLRISPTTMATKKPVIWMTEKARQLRSNQRGEGTWHGQNKRVLSTNGSTPAALEAPVYESPQRLQSQKESVIWMTEKSSAVLKQQTKSGTWFGKNKRALSTNDSTPAASRNPWLRISPTTTAAKRRRKVLTSSSSSP